MTKKNIRVEIKAIAEDGTFEGLLSTYGNVDKGGDLVEPGAYTKTMRERSGEVPLLWQHDPHEPIGKLELSDTAEGLRVKGTLMLDLPTAKKAYLLIKNQVIKGLSIGYEVVKKEMTGGVRRLKEIKLYEGSIVTFPMDELALISAVKRARAEQKDDFNEEWAETQLLSASYQMRSALCNALDSFLYDDSLTREERLSGIDTSIQQFSDAYSAFAPQFLDLLDEETSQPYPGGMGYMSYRAAIAQKAGRRHSAADREKIQAAISTLSALLSDEAGSTTSEEEAAPKSEPVEDHSAAQSLTFIEESLDGLRSLIPRAA
jgi:HK97 family phage prohead protease